VSYLLSPVQLIPTFIPVIGQLDDIVVLLIGMKLLRRLTPCDVIAECEERAKTLTFFRRRFDHSALPEQAVNSNTLA
jgi:uncharacterized membrane protein YkvA (DUF1232 family)